MSSAIHAYNTKLRRGAGDTVPGPETFVDIAEIQSVAIDLQQDTVEVTHMQSPGKWKEFIPTNKSMTVRADGNFLPTDDTHDGTAGIAADLKNGAVKNYKFVLPDTTTYTLSMIVTSFSTDPKHDDKLSFSAAWQVTGQPTLV